jgi:hypothetical protein
MEPMELKVDHRDVSTDTATTLLAEHYQKTYELTYDFWRQRNKLFLLLVAAVAVTALLTAQVPEANSLLVDLVARLVGVSDNSQRVEELRRGLPYALIQSALLIVVFYLTFSLYHRTSNVRRLYSYLAKVETDLRCLTNFGAAGFTREGAHYTDWKPVPLKAVGYIYTGLLGLLLAAMFAVRIFQDIESKGAWAIVVDVVIAIPTVFFYGAYANDSLQK